MLVSERTECCFWNSHSSNVPILSFQGFKVLQVIQNNATAYLHTTHIKKWDICAGDAILGAIGGRMSDLHNENIVYHRDTPALNPNGLLAAALSSTHEAYIKRIVESKRFVR